VTATISTPTTPAPPSLPKPKRRRGYHTWLVLLAIVATAMTVSMVSVYLPLDPLQSRLETRNQFHWVVLLSHLFTAAIALVTGVLQFWPWLRTRHRKVHRIVGRTYLFAGVLPSAVFGVGSATMAVIGMPSAVPLTILSLLWFITGVQGFRAARDRRFTEHREWMIRNFALTATAITGRIVAVPLVIFFEPADAAARVVFDHDLTSLLNWGAFTVHLLVAEWYITRTRRKARR
jgi:uncharacterized membrane protein